MNRTGFVYHTDFVKHLTGSGHPERPERLISLMRHLSTVDIYSDLILLAPKPAGVEVIKSVHDGSYVERLQKACKSGLHYLDSDTVVCENSFAVAALAAGAGIEACRAVMDERLDNAFCAVRPPGHHAESSQAMGFCLFNNVAVAARWLQSEFRLKKICIIDWDVHHGNGTQSAFYDDPSVLYVSIHQSPLYPGTGSFDEVGRGEGRGATLNIPVSAGCQDADYLALFEKKVVPIVRDFQPDFLLVSAGFDAHKQDPLANMEISESGFAEMTEVLMRLANECCSGKLVSFLEGGYDLDGLNLSVEAHLKALVGN